MMFRFPCAYIRQQTIFNAALIPATSRCICNFPPNETFSIRSTALTPHSNPSDVTCGISRQFSFDVANAASSSLILAPFIMSSLPNTPDLLLSSIIKKRKKKMNKHKWKKRRRLVRYKNKPWFIFTGHFWFCNACSSCMLLFGWRLCMCLATKSKPIKENHEFVMISTHFINHLLFLNVLSLSGRFLR